jgi:tRNA dimethylallyltransferase
VFRGSGRPLTEWHRDANTSTGDARFIKIALIPEPRATLHERIALRLERMLEEGFVSEVRSLMERQGLTADHSSMRAVGYRQFWAHLEGSCDYETALYKALVATRQLAKRQLTWLRGENDVFRINPLEVDAYAAISEHLGGLDAIKTAIATRGL